MTKPSGRRKKTVRRVWQESISNQHESSIVADESKDAHRPRSRSDGECVMRANGEIFHFPLTRNMPASSVDDKGSERQTDQAPLPILHSQPPTQLPP